MSAGSNTYRKHLGRQGESIAESYLRSKGYLIRERNFQIREGEIDLIAEAGDLLIFVEVKTGQSGRFGHPADKVDLRKQQRMILAAEGFLQKNRIEERDCRFDVIAVRIKNGRSIVEHIQDAFQVDPDHGEI